MAARSIAVVTDKQLTYRLQNSGIPPQTGHEGKKKVSTVLVRFVIYRRPADLRRPLASSTTQR